MTSPVCQKTIRRDDSLLLWRKIGRLEVEGNKYLYSPPRADPRVAATARREPDERETEDEPSANENIYISSWVSRIWTQTTGQRSLVTWGQSYLHPAFW